MNKVTLNNFKAHYLLKLITFWLVYFALFRLLFVVYHHSTIPRSNYVETSLSFVYGFRLDVSTACILVFFPFVLWMLQQFFTTLLFYRINQIYNYCAIVVISVLSIANIKMYEEWGTLLSVRALKFMLYPTEALSFISVGPLLILIASCVFFSFFGLYFYRKFETNFSCTQKKLKQKMAEFFVTPILLIVGARGGLQQAPINESNSYFSHTHLINLIAKNNIWYLGHSIVDANDERNPYLFLYPE